MLEIREVETIWEKIYSALTQLYVHTLSFILYIYMYIIFMNE